MQRLGNRFGIARGYNFSHSTIGNPVIDPWGLKSWAWKFRRRARAYRLAVHKPDILVNGHRVAAVWDEQARPWFLCPGCGRRCKHLYLDELRCRICCRLDYACRHQHRTVPGLHRIKKLRRMISADPRPFTPLPWRPRHHKRFRRIMTEIRMLERGLVEYMSGIGRDLERRARRRGMIK